MKIRHTTMGLALCAVVLLSIGTPVFSAFAEEAVVPEKEEAAEPTPAPAPAQSQPQAQPQPSVPAAVAPPLKPAETPPAPAVSGEVRKGDVLTMDRCVKIALERHPAIAAAAHSAGAAESKIGQARSGYYPQVSLSTGYNKYSLATAPANTVQGLYSSNATLTQSIFEFGKTWNQVTIQQRNYDAARSDLQESSNQIVLGVRSAYYNLLQARKSVEVLTDTVKSFEQHLDQAKAFFETGVKSKYDVTTAEVNLSNARLSLIRGRSLLKTQQATLNNAMGMPDAPEYAIADDLAFTKCDITYEEAVQRAYTNRPDLRAQVAREEAASESVTLAKKGHLPTLTGSAGYTWQGERYPVDQSGWNAGILLTFPLFNGFQTSYQVSEAKETYYAARANEQNLRQQVLLDVQQNYVNLQDAEQSMEVAALTVKQAEENYDIAKGRYSAGVGSIIDETDALVTLRNARLGLINAQVQYKTSEASLKKSMGEQ